MRIKVNDGYRVAFGQHIDAGEYDEKDPALFGLATYLVANHHAEVVAEAPPSPSVKEAVKPFSTKRKDNR